MKEFWKLGIILGLVSFGGFLMGNNTQNIPTCARPETKAVDIAEEAIVRFDSLKGDQVSFSLQGEGRIIIDQHTIFEEEGTHTFSIAQLPSSSDLDLRLFPYLGNTKTQKFYNTDSYPARGTEVKYRRFFKTQEEAKEAGFIASKNLK